MKIEVTEVAPCRKKIEVEIPVEKVNSTFDEIYKAVNNQVSLKGFRKGHAPKSILKRKYAAEIAQDARGKLFEESFRKCMTDNKLNPLSDPDIKVEDLEAKQGEVFAYSTEVDVRPEFDLPEYKGLKLNKKVKKIEDKAVDEQIEKMKVNFATYEDTDKKSAEDFAIEVDGSITCDGEEIRKIEDQRAFVSGEKLFGLPVDNVVKNLSGLSAGDEKTFTSTIPDDYHQEEQRGKSAEIKFTVKAVKEQIIPEINDEFATKLGTKDLADLKEKIKQNMEQEQDGAAREGMDREAVEKLVEACSFELPEAFLNAQTEAMLSQAKSQMMRMGATEDMMKEDDEETKKNAAKDAELGARRMIIFDAIAEKEKVEVSEKDFMEHINRLAQSYRIPPQQMIQQIQQMNGMQHIAQEIRDIKVSSILIDNAEVETIEVTEDDK